MAPAVLHRVCHGTSNPSNFQRSLLKVRPAILHSYRRHRVMNADYPAIVPTSDPSSAVRGTFVTGLTDGDVWRLDIFEGEEYERRRVEVKVLENVGDVAGEGNVEGEEVECETYVWIAGREGLEDEEWDFNDFVKTKMRRWVGDQGEGEYAGRASFLGSCAFVLDLAGKSTDCDTEVDDAVRSQGDDPTRGRGINGSISKSLEQNGEKEKEVLESAV